LLHSTEDDEYSGHSI